MNTQICPESALRVFHWVEVFLSQLLCGDLALYSACHQLSGHHNERVIACRRREWSPGPVPHIGIQQNVIRLEWRGMLLWTRLSSPPQIKVPEMLFRCWMNVRRRWETTRSPIARSILLLDIGTLSTANHGSVDVVSLLVEWQPFTHQWLVMHLLDTCTLSTSNQGSVDVQQWTTAGWSQKSGYPCRPLLSPGENVNK